MNDKEQVRENFGFDSVENYDGDEDKKCPAWLLYSLIALGILLLLGAGYMLWRGRGKKETYTVSSNVEQRFGFRFY